MLPLETLPPGDQSGGVFYIRIVLSPEEACRLWVFLNILFFTGSSCQPLAQPPSWSTTPCRLAATTYSIYSQLPSISEAVPPSATWGRAMSWWQGPTNAGLRMKNGHYVSLKISDKFLLPDLESPRRYPYNDVVVTWFWELCYSVSTRMTYHAREVKGDDPDKKGYPGPPGWGFLAWGWSHPIKIYLVKKLLKLETGRKQHRRPSMNSDLRKWRCKSQDHQQGRTILEEAKVHQWL